MWRIYYTVAPNGIPRAGGYHAATPGELVRTAVTRCCRVREQPALSDIELAILAARADADPEGWAWAPARSPVACDVWWTMREEKDEEA